MLIRFTPRSFKTDAFSSETVAGFISSVHSSKRPRSSRSRSPPSRYSNWEVLSALGVPPPKKMVWGAIFASIVRASNSRSTESKNRRVLFRSLASL